MSTQQPSPNPVPVDRVVIARDGTHNFRAAAAVGLIVGVIDVMIGGRFLLKLLGASAQSSFVNFVYAATAPMVAPFHGIFSDSGSSANVFEPAALVAMVVFALIG